MPKKDKKFYAVLIVIILLFSAVLAVVQFQIYDVKNDKMPLTVKIFADKPEGTAPFYVNFSSIVTNNNGKVNYRWDFGDGNTSDDRNPRVSYDIDGEFVCSLKVTDENGESEKDSIIIKSKKNKAPVVILSVTPTALDRKLTWISLLSFVPIKLFTYPGNHQEMLDKIEERQGPNAWGEGRVVVNAQITDQEDDEIVSYDWIVKTSDSLMKHNGDSVLRVHHLEGNESVTIPELFAWIPFEHVVTLTVTDSAGNKANGSTYFTVSKNATKQKIEVQLRLLVQVLILQVYNQLLPEEYKHLISDPLWKAIFEPICKILPIGSIIANIFPQPIPKAKLNNTLSNYTFDHSDTINENGGVEEESEITHKINIRNDDKENTAYDVYIKLVDPAEGEGGLDAELEKNNIIVSLEKTNSNETLYGNKMYTDGCSIGDLTPGSGFNAKLKVKFLETKNETFKDNKTYECKIFIYQKEADYWRWGLGIPPITKLPLDEIKFTIKT